MPSSTGQENELFFSRTSFWFEITVWWGEKKQDCRLMFQAWNQPFTFLIVCTLHTLDNCKTPWAALSPREAFGFPIGLSWAGRVCRACVWVWVTSVDVKRHIHRCCSLYFNSSNRFWFVLNGEKSGLNFFVKAKKMENRPKSKNRKETGFFKVSSL